MSFKDSYAERVKRINGAIRYSARITGSRSIVLVAPGLARPHRFFRSWPMTDASYNAISRVTW